MKRLPIALVLLIAGCGGAKDSAAVLKESIETIGDEMIALHEPRRIVEYHDSSGRPFWVAFIPPHTDAEALAALAIPGAQQCPPSDRTIVAVGGGERPRCADLKDLVASQVHVIRKEAGVPVRMTLALDFHGYRIVDVR
jgi:hypothetical protein